MRTSVQNGSHSKEKFGVDTLEWGVYIQAGRFSYKSDIELNYITVEAKLFK